MTDTEKLNVIKQELEKRFNTNFFDGENNTKDCDMARKAEISYFQQFIERLDKGE